MKNHSIKRDLVFAGSDQSRLFIMADKQFMFTFEIPRASSIDEVKLTFRDFNSKCEQRTGTCFKSNLSELVADAIQKVIIQKSRFTYPMGTPNGKEVQLRKEDIELFDLVLNEPEDEVIFNHIRNSGEVFKK